MGKASGIRVFHVPRFVVNTLTLLSIIEESISSFFSIILGLFNFLGLEEPSSHIQENHTIAPFAPPLPAVLIGELLPTVKFSDVACSKNGGEDEQPPPRCAVCLYEFEGDQEIRCLVNCQHFFHRGCIDAWMEQGRNTCPLCRKSLLSVVLRDESDYQPRAVLYDDYCLFAED